MHDERLPAYLKQDVSRFYAPNVIQVVRAFSLPVPFLD